MTKKQLFHHSFNMPPPVPPLQQLLQDAMRQHQQGNSGMAEQLYRQLLQRQPDHAHALNLLGVLLSQQGRQVEGEQLLREAIKIEAKVPDYHSNLGLCLQQQGKHEEAAAAFRAALRLFPGFAPAWFGLGNVHLALRQPDKAIENFIKTIEINPDYLPAYNNLGNLYCELMQYEEALKMLNRALEIKPNFAEAWYNLGLVYKSMGDGPRAVEAFTRAADLKPEYYRAYSRRGQCRGFLLNDMKGAIDDCDRAIEINPRYVPAYLRKAGVYQAMGHFEEAEQTLRSILEFDASSLEAYLQLIQTRTYNEDDVLRMQSALDELDTDAKQLVDMHFSLGNIFDDRKDYARAFHHYQQGNQLHRRTIHYDADELTQYVSRIIAVFDEDFLARHDGQGLETELPVFILGMPRSGTTLTEQIVASHPRVYGAGELDYLRQIAIEFWRKYPDQERAVTLAQADIQKFASAYMHQLGEHSNDVMRITDKMPQNFFHVGLIRLLFPCARIIHCRRNPMDTCLSIYFQKFTYAHNYGYDLAELGHYYRQYLRLMEHWEQVLPGRMLTVRYEDMVEDQEAMSRKLIGFAGLDWDDRCLRFFETERAVKTASQWQVRQQVYTTSRERWRHYEPWLKPLMEALGEEIAISY